jgi:uncharacterized protein (TIGR00266 family)
MKHEINGTTMQTLEITLEPGDKVFCESGGMSWMDSNIEMSTDTKGGVLKGIGRMFSGDSFFLTTYSSTDGIGKVTFSSEYPGKIIDLDIGSNEYICQKDAFMCAENSVHLAMHFHKKLGAGLVGGEGFIMQKLSGKGKAFVEIDGEVTELTLQAGETIKVDPGHIALFESTVNFDWTTTKGLKNKFFSGEGWFLATLTGPGKIWLQSMPILNLAKKLIPYLPLKQNQGTRINIGSRE